MSRAQQIDSDPDTVIRRVDAAAHAKVEKIDGYMAIEHYSLYRGDDESKPPFAEITVTTNYRKSTGKEYTKMPEKDKGPEILRELVLGSILKGEKEMSRPGIREGVWITSANYEMTVQPKRQNLGDRDYLVISITPKRKSPYLLEGRLWVDPMDYSIVKIYGIQSKRASFWTGRCKITRDYKIVKGLPLASHARAESNSFLFGQTIVEIEYQYRNQDVVLTPPK